MAISENAKLLKEIRERAGVGVRELARAIDWDASRYHYYEREYKKPFLPDELVELVSPRLVGKGNPPVTIEELKLLASSAAAPTHLLLEHSRVRDAEVIDAIEVPTPISMEKNLPVRGTSEGVGGAGDFLIDGDVVDHVRRLPVLAGRSDVFAIYVRTTACADRIQPGDLLIVESTRPPRKGDFALIEMRGALPRAVYLRLWDREDNGKIFLLTPKSEEPLVLDRRKIRNVYRVMPLADLLRA